MHLLFWVRSVPPVKVQACALVPLQVQVCRGTPSEKLEFGTSMHRLFQLLTIRCPPPVVTSDSP